MRKINSGKQNMLFGFKTLLLFTLFVHGFLFTRAQPVPTITSFSPQSGVVGSSVTITGSGFEPIASNNIVYFGAVRAIVTSASATSLAVTVPTGVTNEPLSVTSSVSNLSGYSNKFFNVTFNSSGVIDGSSFAAKVDYAAGGQPFFITAGDLDGDGKTDLSVTNTNSYNSVSVLKNTAAPGVINSTSFATKVSLSSGNISNDISSFDIDGDGKKDIVETNYGDNTFSVFRNISTAGGGITAASFASRISFTTGSNPSGLDINDIDRDGKPDVVVINCQSPFSISVFRNISTAGNIDFATKVDFAVSGQGFYVKSRDLDGDGKPEIIAVVTSSNRIEIFKNTTTPGDINATSFASSITLITGSTPRKLDLADLDGDGRIDIVAPNQGNSNFSIYRNLSANGSLSFAERVSFTCQTNPQVASCGDLNGDGKPDIAISGGGGTTVFKNSSSPGNFLFTLGTSLENSGDPNSGCIVDIDGDGAPEIITVNYNASSISVYRNTGVTNGGGVQTSISTSALSQSSYCQGSSLPIAYSVTGTFNSGNTFTAQLSDASGDFTNATNIGHVSTTESGNIDATIPANTTAGTGYRIRVVSSDPAIIGSDNGSNITVNQSPVFTSPTVTTLASTQYSDPISPVTVTVTDDGAGTSLAVNKQWKLGTGSWNSGLPSGITLSSPTTGANSSTWTLSGKANVAPGTYTIRISVGDGSCSSYTDLSLTVTQEDATIVYTGNEYYTLPKATATSFNVSLSATVKDITALPNTDPKYDADAGNITNAKVVFHLNNINGTVIGTANVSLVDQANIKVGVASAIYNCPISSTEQSSGGKTLTVYAVVEGANSYYTALSNNPTTVTISCPGADYVTGGGYLLNSASKGTIAGTSGLKTNFGFTMKYNKTGGSPKGQCNIIVRSNGKIYQIKANAINTLSIGAKTSTGAPAYFNTKANYTDITNPLSPISLGGNLDLTVKMNDVSTGGQGDQVSMLLQKPGSSELIFSSNWNGTQTVLQNLGGGNVRVRNALAAKAITPADAPIVEALTLKAYPNPSSKYFTVKFESRTSEKVQLKVVDLLGRPVHLTEGLPNQTYRFGDGFASGSYLLQVTQGDKKQVHKLIKLK